jgi:CRP-like cAMP-binding protein
MQHLRIPQDVQKNRLLASLPTEVYQRLHPHLVPLELEYKLTLYEANQPLHFLYFLDTGVASLVNTMKNGQAAEVGTIGNEGVVGMPVVFGDATSLTSVYMQVAGFGLRIKATSFREIMGETEPLRRSMLHYAHAFFNQVAQTAACNLFHPLEQRCCRWLLTTRDRMRCDNFPLTQEFLAMMLGVQRTGVTLAAANLQRAGMIEYTRGNVKIIDGTGLEHRSCECYRVTKRDFDRLLGIFESGSHPIRKSRRPALRGASLKSN